MSIIFTFGVVKMNDHSIIFNHVDLQKLGGKFPLKIIYCIQKFKPDTIQYNTIIDLYSAF